jgi:hypothetical protein
MLLSLGFIGRERFVSLINQRPSTAPFRLLVKTNFITRLTNWRRRRVVNQQAIFAGMRKSFKQKYLFAFAKNDGRNDKAFA